MSKQKLTYRDLSTMAKRCLKEQQKYNTLECAHIALRYSRIWGRIVKAMCNPYYRCDNSKSELQAA